MNTAHFKDKLEQERDRLTGELADLVSAIDTETNEFREEVADRLEDDAVHDDASEVLEARLDEVNLALEKMLTDDYGHCDICHMEIEEDRLEANPAAATCKTHINS